LQCRVPGWQREQLLDLLVRKRLVALFAVFMDDTERPHRFTVNHIDDCIETHAV
jgi:hypothetical protein